MSALIDQIKKFNLESLWEFASTVLLGIWNFEIFAVDNSPITIKKIFLALIVVAIGMTVSRRLVDRVSRKILPRLRFTSGATAAIQTICYYVCVAIFVLVALEIVHIPITIFTLLGGALAIGVGFGSQNIVNNFISGLILLIEQPIRVNDIIEFGTMRGTVRRIGARSTIVVTPENLEVIVPNSILLESSVTNWTLSDDRVRREIIIGVAYGSATRRVTSVLLEIANNHELVLPTPAAAVMFSDFGENALQFKLRFWIHMQRFSEAVAIETELRHRINEVFSAENIVIAYPQRDLHIDGRFGPIKVELVSK